MPVLPRSGLAMLFATTIACGGGTHTDAGTDTQWNESVRSEGIDKVDLLLMFDNSSARLVQTNLLLQIPTLVNALVAPPCVSLTNSTPHACGADPTDTPVHVRVADMHVGVVSSDLGTPGSSVPGCANTDLGDDGLLNPIRNGQALARHEPWTSAPSTYPRPTDCTDPNEFPSFITFDSGTTDPTTFVHDFQCNAGLYVNGCGLESQLEAVYRALVIHNASDAPGNESPNAGFVRENALLAILMLTDEEDGSVRDCRFANGTPCDGAGAIDVYNPSSTMWASDSLNLRFYLDQPCAPQDPTWPLSRYVDPANPSSGLLALKPGHADRIVFAAIAGVPLAIPTIGGGVDAHTNWDALLGTPSAAGADDFCGRDSSGLANIVSAEGPVSMAQANLDPMCSQRVVPACREEGTTYDPMACTPDVQYSAWPARRIVEIARRFDESPLCNGSPCRNGMVASVCRSDFRGAIDEFVTHIRSRLGVSCVSRPVRATTASDGTVTVECRMRETMPEGVDVCDASRGRVDVVDAYGESVHVTINGISRRVCDVQQVPTSIDTHRPIAGRAGWFLDVNPSPAAPSCTQRIAYTAGAESLPGAITRFECAQ